MSLDKNDPGLGGLEAALAALVPTPGRIDRDTLLFRAGQVSVGRRDWIWPGATATLAVMVLVLGGMLVFRPGPATVERIVYVQIKEPASPVREPADPPVAIAPGSPEEVAAAPRQSGMTYLDLERQVLRWGMEGLPEAPQGPSSSGPPLTRDRLVNAQPEPTTLSNIFDLHSIFQ